MNCGAMLSSKFISHGIILYITQLEIAEYRGTLQAEGSLYITSDTIAALDTVISPTLILS